MSFVLVSCLACLSTFAGVLVSPDSLPTGNGNPHLFARVKTLENDRLYALDLLTRRLTTMYDMAVLMSYCLFF
jgi:hypothetical protein